jgi:hypothetical protein
MAGALTNVGGDPGRCLERVGEASSFSQRKGEATRDVEATGSSLVAVSDSNADGNTGDRH